MEKHLNRFPQSFKK